MSAFDKVIGYDSVKEELFRVLDMFRHPKIYKNLGAELPHGVLLVSDPGMGKTTLAKAFIAESGLKSYTLRRNKNSSDFLDEITGVFHEAAENAPCIIFLDDMDKFANEDDDHSDAPEYVAIQAGIDENAGNGVYVIGTVNNYHKLPSSLSRPGRFDLVIELESPTEEEATKIVEHYMASKKVGEDVNLDDVAKMINYNSCAELESIVNNAAINAAYEREKSIGMKHILSAVLREQYHSSDDFEGAQDETERRKVALHEAGHLVVAESLVPGCVGLASVRVSAPGGFIHLCKQLTRRPYHILVALASKAAVELSYCDTVANGCEEDIRRAYNMIREGISTTASLGFGMVDVSTRRYPESSERFTSENEAVTVAELEKYYRKAKEILLKNKDFLEKATEALLEKDTLLWSDIQKIRESVTVTPVAV